MSGASAGVIARLACHPIDTLKAKLQVQTTTHIRLLPLLTKTIANEVSSSASSLQSCGGVYKFCWMLQGIAGLYRGIGIAAVGGAPATCIYFTTYEVSKEKCGLHSSPSLFPLSLCPPPPYLSSKTSFQIASPHTSWPCSETSSAQISNAVSLQRAAFPRRLCGRLPGRDCELRAVRADRCRQGTTSGATRSSTLLMMCQRVVALCVSAFTRLAPFCCLHVRSAHASACARMLLPLILSSLSSEPL